MSKLTIQAVNGAIRSTEGISKSHKYNKGGRIRSVGAYAEVRWDKSIILDYWTSGYEHNRRDAKTAIPKVIATLESKGFKVVPKEEPFMGGSKIMTQVLLVELAD
jgi:hypothetical protein